jgi:hypothetical protein
MEIVRDTKIALKEKARLAKELARVHAIKAKKTKRPFLPEGLVASNRELLRELIKYRLKTQWLSGETSPLSLRALQKLGRENLENKIKLCV